MVAGGWARWGGAWPDIFRVLVFRVLGSQVLLTTYRIRKLSIVEHNHYGMGSTAAILKGDAQPDGCVRFADPAKVCDRFLGRSESCRSMATDHYTYRVTWSADDGEHVGLCREFPSLSWLAPTVDEAMTGIRRLVNEAATDMQAAGEQPPTALV